MARGRRGGGWGREVRPGAGQPGWVYVMTNPEMPGLVKVGRTSREPRKRASELRTTGVPGRFKVRHAVWAADAARAEGMAHHLLSARRVSGDREFFRVSPAEAEKAVNRACAARPSTPAWVIVAGFALFLFIVALLTGKVV